MAGISQGLPPLIEVKDKVNINTIETIEETKPVKSNKPISFRIDQPIYINGNAIYGKYTIGQKLPIYETQQYEVEEPYEAIERLLGEDGSLVLDENGNPKLITVRKTRMVQKSRRVQIIIDEKFMHMLLGRAAEARTQEDRIYKNEGMRVDIDEAGNTKVTRKM